MKSTGFQLINQAVNPFFHAVHHALYWYVYSKIPVCLFFSFSHARPLLFVGVPAQAAIVPMVHTTIVLQLLFMPGTKRGNRQKAEVQRGAQGPYKRPPLPLLPDNAAVFNCAKFAQKSCTPVIYERLRERRRGNRPTFDSL